MITGFDNYTINQPNNKLVSHLGLGSLWKSPISGTVTAKKYSFLSYLFLNSFIRNIFKGGHIHKKNPFQSPLFFSSTYLPTLPHGITQATILKFYRVRRIRIGSDLKLKSVYVIRNYRHYLDFAPISIFLLGNWCLLLACTYLPPIHRISRPLQALKVRDNPPSHSPNSLTKLNSSFREKLYTLVLKTTYMF